jgi:ribosomal protein L12E/L44/L45/RPP1/RPP2
MLIYYHNYKSWIFKMKNFLAIFSLTLFLAACGGGGGGGGGTEPVATNLAPTVTGDQAVEVLEGVQLTNAYSASDPENAAVTLSLEGTDAAAFTLSSGGDLRFIQVPDFEAPADGGGDNVYNLTIVASDSVNEASFTVAITVTNATEGRVVDGPVAGASVHIDLNGDGIQDANESVVLTDAGGNYSLPVPATFPASIVSIGGTDTHTGKVFENIALVSEIRSASAPVAITPLTTVLVGIESEADRAAFLISLGLGSSLDDVLSADGWAAAESGDANAQAVQRISQQIATAMQAISNVIEGSADAGTSAFDISKIVAAKIVAVAQSAEGIDLASAESMQSIFVASVNEVITDGSVDADVLSAIATIIARVNNVIADVTIDPTSASAADIVKAVQEDVQSKIVSLASGEITVAAFVELVNIVVDAIAVNTGKNLLSGKVIDGYISGATIYLDTNFNGIQDNNEAKVISSDLGSFEFSLTDSQKECLAYVPVRVDVPVGAVDADLGTVTSAFSMVLPPTFGFVESSEQLNVTPLTSVLWDEIEKLLKEGVGSDLTCQTVKENISSLPSFQESLSTSISNVVRHYNIPANKIFADYIANDDEDLSTKAELIVKGLKKSFAETAELRAEYPQADYAEVNYFVFSSMDGDELYPNAWYRETAYQDGDVTFVDLKKISDDLETDIRLIYQSERSGSSSRTNPDLTFGLNKEIESRGGDASDYSCNYQEQITYTEDAKSYELVNLTSYNVSSNSIDDCAFESFAASSQTRYVFWGESYSEYESQGSQFTFDYTVAKQQLSDWTDYQANIDNLNPKALVAYVDSLPKLFCQKGLAQANSVYRSKKYLDGDVSVTITRANDGSYSETRTLPDGTQEITNYLASENPTINSCTTIDSDNDGLEDYYDAAPLDPQVSFVSASRDIDGDGVPDANDPDKDNDGFNNDDDAFPLDASEWLDTDGDNIGNNIDTDDDGDGVADSFDEYPVDSRNFTDTDGDGVYDMYDAAPNDSTNSSAAIFDLDTVTDAGISESLRESGQQTIVFNRFSVQDTSWLARVVSWFAAPVIAQGEGTILSNQTNLVNWDADGSEVGDAILTTDTFFAAEAILSPSGNELYYLTSPTIQGSLRDKQGLDDEWCQLYRVDLDKERTFTCLLEVDDAEVQPVSQSLVWRDDYQRKAMSFRADGTSVVNTSAGPRLLTLDGDLVSFDPSRQPPSGFARQVDNIVWLDDDHVGVTFSVYPEGGGGTTSYMSAFNVLSGDEIDEIEFSDFRIIKNGDRFIGTDGALSWDGSQFTIAQGVSNGVIDTYGNLWQKESVYGLEMTDAVRDLTVSLGVEDSSGPNIYSESGTGTRIRYRDLAFSDNWIASKYSMLSKDRVASVEGVSYSLLQQMYIDLPGTLGSFIKLSDPDLWYYVRSGDETADVTLNYEVVTAAGETEQRTFVLPLETIQNMASIDQTIYDPSQYNNGYELLQENGEGISIEIPNPEAERSSFCVFNTETEAQRCAELVDFASIRTDYENIRNSPARFPDSYYVCPDQSCQAPPGVQNVIIAGDRVIAYFKDSSDNRYYKAEGKLDAFLSDGDSALAFEEVLNGAGESEIIGSANQVRKSTSSTLSGVSSQYADKRIVVSFANRLNLYATLPDLYVVDSANEKLPLARDVVWNSLRNQATLYLAASVSTYAEVTVSTDDWLFLRNSAERYALPDTLKVTVLPSSSFVLDDGVEAIVTDFDPASGYGELFTELSITSNTATIDMVSQSLDGDNIANLLANVSSAKLPMASIPIRVIPSGRGSANVTIELYAGNDSVKDTGERYAELSFTLNWVADGLSALFTVPAQDVEGSFITSSGQVVEITIENFDEDVIGVTTGGVNYPRSLDIRFMQVLNKVNSILPTNILTNGEYTAVVTTDLALVDQDGNALTQLIVKFRIGE